MKSYAFFLLIILMLSSCSIYRSDRVSDDPLHNFNGKTVVTTETITVGEGEVFDGNGNLYDWKGEGDCSQTEGMPPMFKLLSGATLKNIWIRNAPDGVHVKGSNVTIDHMVNVDVCEDAISIKKDKQQKAGSNIRITNSKFYHCEDKAIQLTRGSDILIEGNEFYSCAKAVRIKEQAKNIRFENNTVVNSKHAVKATGGHGVVKNNVFKNSKTGLWAEKNAELIDGGDNVFIDVIDQYRETENGKIFKH